MKIGRIAQAALIVAAALFMMTASASASTITYNTNAAGTLFVGPNSLILNSTGGASATLTFIPNVGSSSGTPSNINFGDFLLACPSCGTQLSGLGTAFGAFTFDLVVTDSTDGATGTFVGSSAGGTVWSDVSNVSITWSPLQLGPGTSNASSGNFGSTFFTISNPTLIVAPNSGTPPGDTTVQGTVNSSTGVPEPTTMLLVGCGLVGLGLVGNKRRSKA